MRKLYLALIAMAFATTSVSAQEKITTGFGLKDNWYGGAMVGATTSKAPKGMHPSIGLELGKQISPIFGLSLQGTTGFNSTPGNNAFDELAFTLNGKVNLMNLFGGYKGSPRLFEIEGVAGIGWLHEFYTSSMGADDDMLTARVGASFNFNVGKEKQWTVSLRPAYLPKIDGKAASVLDEQSRFELMAGVVYHIKGKNGKRHHGVATVYNQAYVDNLNEEINDMRKRAEAAENQNNMARNENNELKSALNDCTAANKKAEENAFKMSMEPVISFRQGKDMIDVNQLSNLENIANYMKSNPEIKLDIKGYASPEGNAEFNQKLSEKRAYTVKEILVNKYEIDADRITAKGMGVGDHFSKPEMNRAIIATFYK